MECREPSRRQTAAQAGDVCSHGCRGEVAWIFGGAFLNVGQVCLAIKRVYAHWDVYDALCAKLARRRGGGCR